MSPLEPPVAAAAAAPSAAMRGETRSLARAFPFLDLYYKLAPDKRTLFTVAYRWRAIAPDGRAWVPARVTLVFAGERRAIASSSLGWLTRSPTQAELASRAPVRLEGPAGWRFGMILAPQLSVTAGPRMDPAELLDAAAQFERGTHAAGPVSVVIPHFRRVLFVGAAGGEFVERDGSRRPVTASRGELFASLEALRGVTTVRFDTPPERVLLLP